MYVCSSSSSGSIYTLNPSAENSTAAYDEIGTTG